MTIPFETPAHLAAWVASGKAVRHGAIFKDMATGRILGHVQETGMLRHALSSINLNSFSPLGVLDLGVSVQNYRQIAHLTQLVQAAGMATIGIGLLGVGISAAGFVAVGRRLGQIRTQISQLAQGVAHSRQEAKLDKYDDIFSGVLAAEQAGHLLADASDATSQEWRSLCHEFDKLAHQTWLTIQRELGTTKNLDFELLEKFTLTHLMCRSAAIEGLVRTNAIDAAQVMLERSNQSHRELFDRFSPIDLTHKQLTDRPSRQQISEASDRARRFIGDLQGRMLHAEQQQILLDTIAARQINGAEYMAQVDQEKNEPFLLLPGL